MSDAPDPAEPTTAAAEPIAEPVIEQSEVTIRRAPRIGVFLFLGGALGLIATLIATSLFEPDPSVGFMGTFGYLCIYGVPFGLLLGAIAALIADAVSRRRAKVVLAERGVVGNPDEEFDDEDGEDVGEDAAAADSSDAPADTGTSTN